MIHDFLGWFWFHDLGTLTPSSIVSGMILGSWATRGWDRLAERRRQRNPPISR